MVYNRQENGVEHMTLYAILAGVFAALVAVWRAYAVGVSKGAESEKRNASDAYTRHLEDVARAADARANARELPNDPNRRD